MPESPGWALPEQFEEYRIVRPLGRGTMGQVFLARDTLLDRMVAVKFLAGARPEPHLRERFFVEARAIARLSHPNVVAVHRVGEIAGRPYLVSELLRGTSLDALAKPLPGARALEIAVGLSRGLAAAHRRGVLHRDIKPANAFLTEDGGVKLLDFGLAKLVAPTSGSSLPAPPPLPDAEPRLSGPGAETLPIRAPAAEPAPAEPRPVSLPSAVDTASLTSPGDLLGSPLYMAPELWGGEPASCASDIYALGTLVYELCAGRAPFQGVPMRDLPMAVRIQAKPLLSAAPEVDPRLAQVVDRCLQLDPSRRFESGDALREALERLLPGPGAGALPPGNPYRGLQSFEAAHRALFFGRGVEIRALLERLRSQRLVVVAGDSGVGKSSLLRAGALPALRDGELGPGETWRVATMVPGSAPVRALSAAVASALGAGEAAIAEELASADPGRALRARLAPDLRLLVLVDQLEELVLLADPAEAASAGRALSQLAAPEGPIWVAATARADFLGKLAAVEGLSDQLSQALFLLGPLAPDRVREAIVGPARANGFDFESEPMIQSLVDAAAVGDGALPLLQFALSKLWDARDEGRRLIPEAALRRLGGVEGALARHADAVLEALLPRQREAARRMLTRLVTVEGTRARRAAAELLEGEDARAVLAALTSGRLLIARGGEAGGGTYELAHEALTTAWGTLREWLAPDRDARAAQQRVERAAAEWERLGRARDGLLSPKQLDEAAKVDPARWAPPERALLAASRSALRWRRARRWAAALAVPLAAGAALGVAQLRARQQRDRAVAARFEEAAAATAEGDERAAEAERRRARAFTRFDAGDREQGEATWKEARAAGERAREAYVSADRALQRALDLDPARAETRRRLGETLLRRYLLAEASGEATVARELLDRLSTVDPSGGWRAVLNAPAQVEVEVDPPGASTWLLTAGEGGASTANGPGQETPRPLGVAPLSLSLPPTSAILIAAAPGRAEVRAPFLPRRGERLHLRLTLPDARAVPDGFVYVPTGRFLHGSGDDEDFRQSFLGAPPLHEVPLPAFLISGHEVTFAEWIAFLEALPPAERRRRTPGTEHVRGGHLALARTADGPWRLELVAVEQALSALAGQPIVYPQRTVRAAQDWLRMPVAAISPDDALAYVEWLRTSGRLPRARLCTELEWERAATGADGRRFPSGPQLAPDDADIDVTYGRAPLAFGPDEVGAHPGGRSPFGVDDLAGNVWEIVAASEPGAPFAARGGCWYMQSMSARSANREPLVRDSRSMLAGLRVCADPGTR